jgi:hypothetical protein
MLRVTCQLLLGQYGPLLFLHISGSYWITCRVHLSCFLLAHVSCWRWSTCHFLIGLCTVYLLVHVVWPQYPTCLFYLTTCHNVVHLCVSFLVDHVSCPNLSTCLFFIRPRDRMDLYHILDLDWPTCRVLALTHVIYLFARVSNFYLTAWSVLDLPRAQQLLHQKNNSKSTLLHKWLHT